MSSASTQISGVAVTHEQPPSRLTRRPLNVVAKIVPSFAIAYFGSNSPPYPIACSDTQWNEQPSSWLTRRPNVDRMYRLCGSVGWNATPLVSGGRPLAWASAGARSAMTRADDRMARLYAGEPRQ